MFPMVAVVVRPLDLYGLVLELVLQLFVEDPSVTDLEGKRKGELDTTCDEDVRRRPD